jgi:hypothetical protein
MTSSYDTVNDAVLLPMKVLYAKPRDCADPDLALAQYVKPLSQYPAPVLAAAWARVVETHELSSWPKPAVILKACREVAGNGRTAHATATSEPPDHTPAAVAAMHGDLGQTALAEGWGRILFDFVRQHGPDEPVPVARLMKVDRDMRATVATLSSDEGGPLRLRALGLKLLRREDELQRRHLR